MRAVSICFLSSSRNLHGLNVVVVAVAPGWRFEPIFSQWRESFSALSRTLLAFASAAWKRKSQSACASCPVTTHSAQVGAAMPEEVASGAAGVGTFVDKYMHNDAAMHIGVIEKFSLRVFAQIQVCT